MQTTIDLEKLHALAGTVINDVGAISNAALVAAGERLGLFKALAEAPATSQELAERTGCAERYLREWLSAQAASGYVTYDPATTQFSLSPEQEMIFVDEESPVYLLGGFTTSISVIRDGHKLDAAFQSGQGIDWGNHDGCLFCGTAKFLQTGYRANLVETWLPALEGVVPKLEAGARVADVGCGYGYSTILMAKAYPESSFFGFDYHEPSIVEARKLASEAGLSNVRFEVAAAKALSGGPYDLIAFFDCLHDMGDPVGAAAHARTQLMADGTLLIVEPFAHDHLEHNLNPVSRAFYAASTAICTPSSLSQEVGLALGAQAGQSRLRAVLAEGGYRNVRLAAESPFNLVLEAKA